MTLPRVERTDEGFRADIGDNWLQGRTAYGGASAAVALTAAKTAFPDLPPLRSAQIAFVGPLAGEISATPVLLRRGKNSSFIACDVVGSDGIGLRALFLFMAPRESSIAYEDLPAPAFANPDDNPVDPAKLPQGFLTNFDLSNWDNSDAGFTRWARLKDRAGLDPEVELIAIADALPPAAMALAKAWGPISTTTWQLNLVTDKPATRDGWWLLGASTLHAGNGSSSQTMTIWNRDGAAVATATQSVALFI
jgi:acyl-CoA thioesterase